jgi:hypothetical protein
MKQPTFDSAPGDHQVTSPSIHFRFRQCKVRDIYYNNQIYFMIDDYLHVTVKEVETSYIFKVIKKVLKQKYPWVMDIYVDADDINQYTLLFLILKINPYILMEQYGWSIQDYIPYNKTDGRERHLTSLDFFFDIPSVDALVLENSIKNFINSVGSSKVIPNELKIKDGERRWGISGYRIPPGSEFKKQ